MPPLRCLFLLLAGFALTATATQAAEPVDTPACRVVIVGGQPGSVVLARRFADWTTRFRAWCVDKAGVPAANITLMSAADKTPASADAVLKAIAEAAGHTAPADQFVLFLVGHGDTVDGEAALTLPGRNLRVSELRAMLARVPARRQVILHFGAASGDAIAALASSNRVVVAATAPGEISDPVFAEFFLLALEREPAAHAGSLLDVYNGAALETARWIRRLSQTESGAWHVDGKQSIAIFHKLCDGPADVPGARALDSSSQPLETEPELPLVSPSDPAAAAKLNIPARIRIVDEHATLADTGRDTGVAGLGEKEFAAVTGSKEGEPGFLAAHTVLGR